jgi:hypothetical protein
MTKELYMEIGGFLTMLSKGMIPSNTPQQAGDLLMKVGDAMEAEHGPFFEDDDASNGSDVE